MLCSISQPRWTPSKSSCQLSTRLRSTSSLYRLVSPCIGPTLLNSPTGCPCPPTVTTPSLTYSCPSAPCQRSGPGPGTAHQFCVRRSCCSIRLTVQISKGYITIYTVYNIYIYITIYTVYTVYSIYSIYTGYVLIMSDSTICATGST